VSVSFDNFYAEADHISGVVPEPATLIMWSILATLGASAGWWRRRHKAIERSIACFAIALVAMAESDFARGSVSVPGYNVDVYAEVSNPEDLAFDPAGNLYVGRGLGISGSPASQAVPIHRIGPGGCLVQEYGPEIIDPDFVLYDAVGALSGAPGSVLVGGLGTAYATSQITAILPDQSTEQVFYSSAYNNNYGMAWDSTGRLVFTTTHNLLALDPDGTLTHLASLPDAVFGTVAVDANDQIYVGADDGAIRRYGSDGTLLEDAFGTGIGWLLVAKFAQGGPFGTDLYALDRGNNTLVKFDTHGNSTLVGTGFNGHEFMTFGADGALYVADYDNDRVLRITAVPEPSAIAIWCVLASLALSVARRRRAAKVRVK
jgi:hypothetical protein